MDHKELKRYALQGINHALEIGNSEAARQLLQVLATCHQTDAIREQTQLKHDAIDWSLYAVRQKSEIETLQAQIDKALEYIDTVATFEYDGEEARLVAILKGEQA